MKIPCLLSLLVVAPLMALAQQKPEPLLKAPNGNAMPQADPTAIAAALTSYPKTPMPPPIEWIGWMKLPPGIQSQTDIVIGKGGDQTLHAEIAWPEHPRSGLMPAIIWIHGGAWQGESQHPNHAAYFATRGYFGASIEYRLAPKNKWPAQIEDCKLAVRWLRANAAKYHVDPERIGVWGASAGGHLVSCVGTLDDPALDTGDYAGISSRVQAVCDWCGPVDFRVHGGPGVLFTQSFKENPALHLSASPIAHIKKDQPPFLVVQGDKDPSVAYAESVNFVVAMRQAGAPVEFLSIHNGNHGMGPAAAGSAAELSMSQVLGRMAEFFDRHLKPAAAKN